MPIIDLQSRLVELGRIRIGVTVKKGGKSRPEKLETFRFTTASRDRAEAVSKLFGGNVQEWSPDGNSRQWEVISPVSELPVVVPPGQAVTQWYELWTGGGCVRRCDGRRNVLRDVPCECPADPSERSLLAGQGKACKPTTRVNVILRDLPGVGVWRLESHGFYAAVELAGTATLLEAASATGQPLPATLRLDQRTSRRDGQTRRYAVPVLDVGVTVAELQNGTAALPPVAALEAGPDDSLVDDAERFAAAVLTAKTLDELRALWRNASNRQALAEIVGDANGEPVTLGALFDSKLAELQP